jgi:uncharacterized membrane protein
MSPARHIPPAGLWALVVLCAVCVPAARARIESELAPPDKRKATVEKAATLAKRTVVAPLASDLADPYAPPGFDLTDAEEAAAAAAAARQAALLNPGAAGVAAPPTDRQLLESIVAKIVPSGSLFAGGKPMLMFGKRFVKIGSHFTVTYKGTDYDLELTDIDGSNYTLRYNREEITRPIKPGK